MGNPDWLAYGYSAAVTSGGLMGYMKAGEIFQFCIDKF